MFDVDGFTIRMKRGETGAVCFRFIGYNFESDDRVIFKVRQGNSTIYQEEYTPDSDKSIMVYFLHSTTMRDDMPAGSYTYDIIFVLNPYRDEDGYIRDGDQVLYPYDSQTLILEPSSGLWE